MSVGVAVDPDGNEHYACIGESDGALYYFPPGWSNWGRVDSSQAGAISGAGITINDEWWVTLTFTNGSRKPCQYRKKFREGEWGWSVIGDINAKLNTRRNMHVTRKIITLTPVLLVLGIIAQVLLLVVAIVLFVPCLIWPAILDGPYRWVTKGMARIMARNIMGRRRDAFKIAQGSN